MFIPKKCEYSLNLSEWHHDAPKKIKANGLMTRFLGEYLCLRFCSIFKKIVISNIYSNIKKSSTRKLRIYQKNQKGKSKEGIISIIASGMVNSLLLNYWKGTLAYLSNQT